MRRWLALPFAPEKKLSGEKKLKSEPGAPLATATKSERTGAQEVSNWATNMYVKLRKSPEVTFSYISALIRGTREDGLITNDLSYIAIPQIFTIPQPFLKP